MPDSARKEMTPLTDDASFIRGNERIGRLAERPDLAEDVARIRRDMEDADRTYAMGLAALRQAADLTQVELARKLGVSLIVQFADGQAVDLNLSALAGTRLVSAPASRCPRYFGTGL